ncbi:MAG: retropepsin-like aspartic protease [Pseudomonadota bacterium]
MRGYLIGIGLLLSGWALAQSEPDNAAHREQIQAFAEDNGFEVRQLQKIGPGAERFLSGGINDQLRQLLSGYGFVMLQDDDGKPETVIVVGPREEPANDVIVATRREGVHQLVDVVLVGPGGKRLSVDLLVDTGASTVVLRNSAMEALGISPEVLETGIAITANGEVEARIGTLPTLLLGGVKVDDVRVSFVPDEGLIGRQLLGMSVLGRYRFTLDERNGRLILDPSAATQ